MSYLQYPRLIFAGQYQADPPTVNNDPEHFDTAKFQSNYDLPGAGTNNGWWNPKGSGAWRFKDCVVQQVQYLDGSSCDNGLIDPVVGMPINSVVDRVEGKLVDLDAEQQMVSAIWGFQVFLGGKVDDIGFGGDFEVASFGDIWVRYPQGSPDSFFGAYYQSIIDLTKCIIASNSRFLQELETAIGSGSKLSIKFNVDGYDDDRTSPTFTFGRVTGSIGAYYDGEPAQFVAGRALWAGGAPPTLNTSYAIVQGQTLHLDLGNSLPTTSAGGPIKDLGNLVLATGDPLKPTLLGNIQYTEPDWYSKTAGIVSFALTAAQLTTISKQPLMLLQLSSPMPNTTFAAENPNGQWVRADQFVFRFNPTAANGDTVSASLYATQFGLPLPQAPVSFCIDNTLMQGFVVQGPGMIPGPPVGTPESALTFPGSSSIGEGAYQVQTNGSGVATLTIMGSDPGNPRKYIDGQVYGVTYQLGPSAPALGQIQNPSQILNLLVFSAYTAPAKPTWIADVQPIFQQYANLYPIMRRIVDLGNYGSVMKHINILQNVFNTPVDNANYMPVTRDLSDAKRNMLLAWLQNPVYLDTNSVSQLKMALQTAIELEHSTIPTYLTALYSIKPNTNTEVAALIRGIVIEEMLHMHLVCNILIAIGGRPAISKPGFVPRYPGSLPGGLRTDLNVTLKKCSIEQIRECFMGIEMPSEMVTERMRWLDPKLDAHIRGLEKAAEARGLLKSQRDMTYADYTIGWFYDQISRALTNLNNAGAITFDHHADWQVTEVVNGVEMYRIDSLESALNAIATIKEQGEGASPVDPQDGSDELAHYYKFSEIVEGRRLEPSPAGWAYTGPRIYFNPDEVWPMVDNPGWQTFPAGSRAALLSAQFAESYQALLFALHDTFNGNPGNLKNAIGTMYSLGLQATELMQTPSGLGDGTTAGPQFVVNFESY